MKTATYPSRKSIAKLSLSQVIAKLLATGETDRRLGRFSLGRRKLFNDELHRKGDPFFTDKCLSLDQEIDLRLRCYEAIARSALFSHGVTNWVQDLSISELNKEIAARNLTTVWSDRQADRSTKERLLITAIHQDR